MHIGFFFSCLSSKPQACDRPEISERDQICCYSFHFSYTVCVSVAEKECFCKLSRRRIVKPSACLWLYHWLLVWHLANCLILCTSNSPPVTDGLLTAQRWCGNEVCKVKWHWKKRQKESKNVIAVCQIMRLYLYENELESSGESTRSIIAVCTHECVANLFPWEESLLF